jgi:hypothetical protein
MVTSIIRSRTKVNKPHKYSADRYAKITIQNIMILWYVFHEMNHSHMNDIIDLMIIIDIIDIIYLIDIFHIQFTIAACGSCRQPVLKVSY